mmetsp:Transcript_32107/g.90328  ORF Transcript_32107/g.90328 Transcript_32107/m.90328 type:complete len:484 (+) Transcript_32107:33-1484(+)
MVELSVFRQILVHAALLVLALPPSARAGYVMRRAEHGKDNTVAMTVTSDAQVAPAELPRDLPPDEEEEVGKGLDLGQGAANSTAFSAAADGECSSGCIVKWQGGKKKCMPADSLIEDQELKKCDDWKHEVCAMFPNAPYYSYRRRYLYAKIAHQNCPHTCAKYNDLCLEHSTEITIVMETPAPTTQFLLDAESAKAKPGKSTAHAKKTTALKQEESAPDGDDDDGGDDDGGDDGGKKTKESTEDAADDAIDEKEDAQDAAEDAKQAEEAVKAADNGTADADQPQEEQDSDDDKKTSDADTETLEEEATHENSSDDKDAKEDAEPEQPQEPAEEPAAEPAEEPAEEGNDDDPQDGSLAEHAPRQVQLPPRPEDGKGADPGSKTTAKIDVGSMERQIKKIRDDNMTRKKEAAEEREKISGAAKDHLKGGVGGGDKDGEVGDPGPDEEQEPAVGSAGGEEAAGGDADPVLRQEEVPRAPQRGKFPE